MFLYCDNPLLYFMVDLTNHRKLTFNVIIFPIQLNTVEIHILDFSIWVLIPQLKPGSRKCTSISTRLNSGLIHVLNQDPTTMNPKRFVIIPIIFWSQKNTNASQNSRSLKWLIPIISVLYLYSSNKISIYCGHTNFWDYNLDRKRWLRSYQMVPHSTNQTNRIPLFSNILFSSILTIPFSYRMISDSIPASSPGIAYTISLYTGYGHWWLINTFISYQETAPQFKLIFRFVSFILMKNFPPPFTSMRVGNTSTHAQHTHTPQGHSLNHSDIDMLHMTHLFTNTFHTLLHTRT